MAPQLATVDVTLNAFYGIPMLSPTTRSLQNLKLSLQSINLILLFYFSFQQTKIEYTVMSKKVTNKHVPLNGWIQTVPPEGDCRRNERLSLAMTVIIQTWKYNEKIFRRRTICHWGMKLAMAKLLSKENCKRFNFMPSDVKKTKHEHYS